MQGGRVPAGTPSRRRTEAAPHTVHPVSQMSRDRFDIPATTTLLAFEAVARNGSINRAARERRTSPAAISRHIRRLEHELGVALFARSGRGIVLTENGEEYLLTACSSMAHLHATGCRLRTRKTDLIIGCTLEISGLVLLPVFSALKRFLGEEVAARIVVHECDIRPVLVPAGLDIVFEERVGEAHSDEAAVKVLDEAIVPVASPAFLERFESVLAKDPRQWSGVPRLDVGRPGPGWATWETWFGAHGCTPPDAPVEIFENYIHLLRAASDGDGIALGWNGFMSDYLKGGLLVPVRDEWLRTDLAMYGVPTLDGRRNRATKAGLRELARLIGELCGPKPTAVARRADWDAEDFQLGASPSRVRMA